MRWTMATMVLAGLAGCAPATGDLAVLLRAEDSVPDGLAPGSAAEDIVDGWAVSFDRYLISIGDVRVERTAVGLVEEDPRRLVVDLASIPAAGIPLARFEQLEAARWDVFGYRTPPADGATRHESVAQVDFDEMVANGWTHLIEGTLEAADGQSCPPGGVCRDAPSIAFRVGLAAPTRFGPCEAEEGLPGVVVGQGGTTVAVTIHGDHIFFDAFPSGAEVIERRAQWLANADLDGDDRVTTQELRDAPAAELFPSSLYNLAGAPIPITRAADYARSQLATQGHFQGEGECPWQLERP